MEDRYIVKKTSLSYVGDLLRDKLGSSASSYLFPDDFEQAIMDIGFTACIYDGTSEPYDLIVVGNAYEKSQPCFDTNNGRFVKSLFKTVTFLGATKINNSACRGQSDLTSATLNNGITIIEQNAFKDTSSLKSIIIPDSVTTIKSFAFQNSGIESFSSKANVISESDTNTTSSGTFYKCASLKTVNLPNVGKITGESSTRGIFYNCSSLETLTLGSINHPVTQVTTYAFEGCTSVFTVTIYCASSYVDTAITNIRNQAANCTIIVKAPTDTTYNNVSYSAGDTMVTSLPASE